MFFGHFFLAPKPKTGAPETINIYAIAPEQLEVALVAHAACPATFSNASERPVLTGIRDEAVAHANFLKSAFGDRGGIAAIQAVYNGEEITEQATVQLANKTYDGITISASAASEAFDEPLSTEQVTAIVSPFIR